MAEKTQGHGYFRKKKWAKGLVSGIAVAGIVAFSAGSVLADEAVQLKLKRQYMYATQAGKTTGSQSDSRLIIVQSQRLLTRLNKLE